MRLHKTFPPVRRIGVACVATGTLLGVAACGSAEPFSATPSGSPTSATPTPSRAGLVSLVDAYPSVAALDVYADGRLVTGAQGTTSGQVQPFDVKAGTRTVTVFEHTSAPLPQSSARTDTFMQQQDVTVPKGVASDVVIGLSPAGGVGLPYVAVYANDTPPASGSVKVVVRHVADAPPVRVTLQPPQPSQQVAVDVGRGEQVVLPASASGDVAWSVLATNAPWFDSALGHERWHSGDVVVLYASGSASVDTAEGQHSVSTFTAYERVLL